MEKVESIRERLLSRLPQTDDIAAYKEEVAVLLAKHERALYWDGIEVKVIMFIGVLSCLLGIWARTKGLPVANGLLALAGLSCLGLFVRSARHRMSQSQVELLKEIKQLQVQMLELQTSMRKSDDE